MNGPLSADDAIEQIRRLLNEGYVIPSAHCKERLRQRNAAMQDVLHVLRHGAILRPAEWDDFHSNWKYRVEGTDIEGDELVVITVIIRADATLLIATIF